MEVIEKVREVAQGYLKEHDIEIVDITFRREQQGLVLRVLADNPRGITVNECEGLNSYLSEALDKEDVIRDRYILEVASPGLDRPIKTDRDFEHSLGKVLEITTYEAIDGRKTHEGKFVGMDKDNIVVEANGISVVIPKAKIALARFKIEF